MVSEFLILLISFQWEYLIYLDTRHYISLQTSFTSIQVFFGTLFLCNVMIALQTVDRISHEHESQLASDQRTIDNKHL